MDAPGVLHSWREAGTLWVRMNRPEALNALSPDMVGALSDVFADVATDPGVRVVVLTGSGRAFCAGADLKHVRRVQEQGGLAGYLQTLHNLFHQIESCPKPVIAAVNGLAMAGGLELLLCCDLVVAVRSARLADAHAKVGLLPGGGATVRLPRAIGLRAAKLLLYTGEAWTADVFHALGLVNQLVDDDGLDAAATELARCIQANSPVALAGVKALVQANASQPLEAALAHELAVSTQHAESADALEGVRAFEGKRAPRFGAT